LARSVVGNGGEVPLRHSATTHFGVGRGHAEAVQRKLGHTSPAMTFDI
jgi:hypothetical protein